MSVASKFSEETNKILRTKPRNVLVTSDRGGSAKQNAYAQDSAIVELARAVSLKALEEKRRHSLFFQKNKNARK